MRRLGLLGLGMILGWARHGGTFVENRGQIYAEVRYEAVWQYHRIYLTPTGVALLLVDPEPMEKAHFDRWGEARPVRAHFLRILWVGASPTEPIGEHAEPTVYNFFQGPWIGTGARGFQQVRYKNLYPGIDAVFRLTAEGLKWDWEIHDPASLQLLRLRYEGAAIHVREDRLYIETSIGTFSERLPRLYFLSSQKPLAARYRIEGSFVSYELLEPPSEALVIDPVVVFSTFSGSYSDNWGFTATYDLQGNAFAGGNVNDALWNPNPGNTYFPVTPGAVQGTFGGGVSYPNSQPIFWSTDIALWKTNPTGTVRLWATYLGGSNNEQPHSLVTDPQGNLYLLGATRSNNFPTTPNAYQRTFGGAIDIIIACISSTGDRLLGSTYLGGGGEDGINSPTLPLYYFYADDGRGEIILSDTACYIISSTRSPNFPTTPNAYRTTFSGTMDAVVCMLSLDLSQLYSSTFLGGSQADAGYSIKIGFGGVVYVAGGTNSPNFPTTDGAYQTDYQGGQADGWLAILSPDLSELIAGTYWGTPDYDQIFMIDIDRQGLPWGAGHTEGTLTPTPGAYRYGNGKQFVFSMDALLSQVTVLSVWGSPDRITPNITISAFAADRCGYVYVSGWGGLDVGRADLNIGSTTGLPTTPNANQRFTDGADFYVVAFQPYLSGLAYASFWGGIGVPDHVDGGTSRFDNRGVIYQSVCGGCGGFANGFPTTPGTISTQNRSPNCNNALFKIDFELGDPVVAALAITPTRGCAPFSPTFQNLSQNAISYAWDFGNGQTSTEANPTGIRYDRPGVYTITLVARNAATCNQRDTLRRSLIVFSSPDPSFTYTRNCGLGATFTAAQSETGHTYRWDLGDGTVQTGPSISHTYTQSGTYTVRLVVTNSAGCADSSEQRITIYPPSVRADFTAGGDTCQGRFTFTNVSEGAQQYIWIFASRDTLRAVNPIYTFPAAGRYEVILIAYDSLGCSDTLRRQIFASRAVRANFSEEIDFCEMRVRFTNRSLGAASFLWDFGDGTLSREPNPTHIYTTPGRYAIKLIAFSPDSLCRDTFEKVIEIDFRSQAIASVVVDTCERRVRLVSLSQQASAILWILGGDTASQDTVEWVLPSPGTYTWTLITNPTSLPRCRDTLRGAFTIPEVPSLDSISWEADICGEWIRFQIPLPPSAIQRLWINGILYPPGTTDIRLPFRHPYLYEVEVLYQNSLGCQDTLLYRLPSDSILTGLFFIPNVFTPNGDGVNDIFRIAGAIECIQELAIYDRWGNELYYTRTAPFLWDGRNARGENLPEGAYVYVLRLKNYTRSGTVTLLR